MKILYIVDGRSPIALSWMGYFIQGGHEVHIVSTYPCPTINGVATQYIVPIALSNLYARTRPRGRGGLDWLRKLLPVRVRTAIRQMAVPFTFSQAITRLAGIVERVQPELIHAMRIPYEGMLAAETVKQLFHKNTSTRNFPLLISVWGNDFTLHAQSSAGMEEQTRQVLRVCSALHTDCERDQRLATQWGFDPANPKIVLPGGGGVQLDIFYPSKDTSVENGQVTIINPRGYRAYVCNDTFFQSIPMVIERQPDVHFICPGMYGEGQAHGWVEELGIGDKIDLLPRQSRQQMAELFRQARIMLSITTHDGTPNTLLEAMACGCLPIAGDLESLREWITPGENGLLVNPEDARGLAHAILEAIGNPGLYKNAKEKNLELVKERAEYGKCMGAAEAFYQRIITLNKENLQLSS